MAAEPIAAGVLAWLLTYAVHSTVLIALAFAASALIPRIAALRPYVTSLRERIFKLALVGGLVSASVQTSLALDTWRLASLPSTSTASVASATPSELSVQLVLDETDATPPIAVERTSVDPLAVPLSLATSPEAATLKPATLSVPLPLALRIARLEIDLPRAPIADPHVGAVTPAASSGSSWIFAALALWIAGVVAGLIAWSREWRQLFRCLRGRVPIESGSVYRELDALRVKSGCARPVRLSCAPRISAPITLGFLRAEICIPPRALLTLQRDEIRAVLGHELAHAVRRDPAWLCLCRLLEIVLFFQPLNRRARHRLQDEVESLCDDWSVVHTGESVALASSLTEIAGWIVGDRRALPAPGMVAHGSRLSQRVRRLLDEDRRPEVPQARLALTVAAGLGFTAAAFALPAVSSQAEPEEIDGELDADAFGVVVEADVALVDPSTSLDDEAAELSYRDERLHVESNDDEASVARDAAVPATLPAMPVDPEPVATAWDVLDVRQRASGGRLVLPLTNGRSLVVTDLVSAEESQQEALELLHLEIEALENGLASLTLEVAARGASAELAKRLHVLDTGLERLRAMHAQLADLFARQLSASTATAPAPVFDHDPSIPTETARKE